MSRSTLGLVIVAAIVVSGCRADRASEASPTPNERTAEAFRLSTRAQRAQKAGRVDQAIDYYRRALDLQPNMRGPWNNLGVLLMERKNYLDAVEAFKREADLAPDDPRPYCNAGVAYFDSGWAEQALHYHLLALERDPNWPDSVRGVALAARRLNRADDKIAAILRRGMMIEREPTWRSVFETERLRVEGLLREQEQNSRMRTGSAPAAPAKPY